MTSEKPVTRFVLLLLMPVCAYAICMAVGAFQSGGLAFGPLDLMVLLVVLGYVAAAVVVFRRRDGQWVPAYMLVTYSTLFALAVAEIVLRGVMPAVPPEVPWQPMRRISVAGDAMPGISGTIEFTVNSLGLRGPEVDLGKTDVRILCVGGSTTESLYVTDRLSWPWSLQDRLSERLKKRVFVGNAGKAGLFTLHHEYLLRNYEPAARFEWVVMLVGINDWGALIGRRTYDQRKNNVAFETLTATQKNRALYRRLALISVLEARAHRRAGPTVVQDTDGSWIQRERAQRQAALARNTIRTIPSDFDQALSTYAENLGRIVAITRARNQKLVLVTQPTLHGSHLPEHLERLLIWAHSAEGAYTSELIDRMLDAFNRTTLRVCEQEGLECLDLASMLPKDTSVFYDDVHFNISGSQRIAAILADFLGPRLAPARHDQR